MKALRLNLTQPGAEPKEMSARYRASVGRLSVVLGVGYRPSEYAAHGKDWARRGALMDECVDTLLEAWPGEPFEYRGATVRVTPTPLSQPHPPVMIGGSAKASARRAVRFGLPFSPAGHLPWLESYYYDQCRELGVEGQCLMPAPDVPMLFVHEA